MSNAFNDFGVQPEQGPPLSVPLGFFLIAPLAIIGGGALVLSHSDVFLMRHLPWTMALVHIGTLGFVGAVMLGAIYQMLAVVASPVPVVRVAHLVQALFAVGAFFLIWAFLFDPTKFGPAWHSLTTAFVLFLLPVAVALARSRTRTTTVYGIMLAVAGLAALVTMGALMSRSRAGAAFTGDWLSWLYGHLAMGAIVWIGGLLTAVSYQVVPMFYLTPSYPRWQRLSILLAIAATSASIIVILATGGSANLLIASTIPGALAVWGVHPLATLLLLQKKKRRRVDDSIHFWRAGLFCGPIVLGLVAATWLSEHPRWPVLLGWTVLWGWAGLIIVGMLSRIVPFLVWFHRYSWLVGKAKVPAMRQLWPKRLLRFTLWAHGATLLAGIAAIITRSEYATSATGGGLVVTGLLILVGLLRVALHMRGLATQKKSL